MFLGYQSMGLSSIVVYLIAQWVKTYNLLISALLKLLYIAAARQYILSLSTYRYLCSLNALSNQR